MYLPDGSVPLHPPLLSEDAASLLPDGPKAAVLWRIDLDEAGEIVAVDVRRAVVGLAGTAGLREGPGRLSTRAGCTPRSPRCPRSGRCAGHWPCSGGAIELELPEQEVVPAADGGWTVQVRRRTAVEEWNAEISLLTGMSAARMMLDAGIGLLRTLPAAEGDAVTDLREIAQRLGVDWPAEVTVAELLAGLPRDTPTALALRRARRRRCSGARATPHSTRPTVPDDRRTRVTRASGHRTRTSPRRCGGWSTGSAASCAWRWPPELPFPSGCARRCPLCPQ